MAGVAGNSCLKEQHIDSSKWDTGRMKRVQKVPGPQVFSFNDRLQQCPYPC